MAGLDMAFVCRGCCPIGKTDDGMGTAKTGGGEAGLDGVWLGWRMAEGGEGWGSEGGVGGEGGGWMGGG